ncbi:MAG: Cell division protein FtsI [Peptidoglycan synthetase] (EC [uncultured Sulfurovum sp.]|uniref:Cell division protein FtsI [Peptidoglycan synthetase] (EC) n=1 Tax=uncultured Sulfurovum sp. TaxID=269237 RepID=A0A6S6S9S8_9BACT|nr:MAG: Cell division protein FtsI [Peptidoglycan synthetase] (EC [uncultured Sulfurovum sp.]
MQENKMIRYRSAILLALFMGILLLFVVFLVTMGQTVGSDRHTENKIVKHENKALRGQIISADNFVLAYSKKEFRAEVNTKSIDPKKKSLFIKLFAIYSGLSEEEVSRKFLDKKGKNIHGRIVLTDYLDYRLASDLKSLSYKMGKLGIFRPLNPNKPHLVFGLDILPTSETRSFPHKDLLTPLLGYIQKEEEKGYKKPVGRKGLEKAYSAYLLPEKDGVVQGKSDVLATPLRTAKSQEVKRIDGMNLHLNIKLSFQKKVESVLDDMKSQTAAQEVMAAVMNSETGELLALASSERFDPENIRQQDVNSLNPNFSEYLYEPGSVIKPLTMAIALDQNKIDLDKQIRLGGKLKVSETYTISDDDFFKSLSPKAIIMYSSNIGISKIAWKLTGKELYEGWKKFGLGEKSGIDLSKELSGKIKAAYLFNHKVHAANTAYGYGMLANFMQLMRAYSAFNNQGIAVTPSIVKYMSDQNGNIYDTPHEVYSSQSCTAKTANVIKDMLGGTVNRGTGTAAQYDGLEVGGKTGTAHISERGRYVEKYHSSFFGYVNDKKGHKYTIGVFVIKPRKVYFASQTAAPTFQKIIGKMVEEKYLTVDEELAKEHFAKREAVRIKKHAAYVRKIQAYNKKHGIE